MEFEDIVGNLAKDPTFAKDLEEGTLEDIRADAMVAYNFYVNVLDRLIAVYKKWCDKNDDMRPFVDGLSLLASSIILGDPDRDDIVMLLSIALDRLVNGARNS